MAFSLLQDIFPIISHVRTSLMQFVMSIRTLFHLGFLRPAVVHKDTLRQRYGKVGQDAGHTKLAFCSTWFMSCFVQHSAVIVFVILNDACLVQQMILCVSFSQQRLGGDGQVEVWYWIDQTSWWLARMKIKPAAAWASLEHGAVALLQFFMHVVRQLVVQDEGLMRSGIWEGDRADNLVVWL